MSDNYPAALRTLSELFRQLCNEIKPRVVAEPRVKLPVYAVLVTHLRNMERFLLVSPFNLRPEIATLDDKYVPFKLFRKEELF